MLRNQLENLKRKWIEELHSVLWAYKTIPQTATTYTPFMLDFSQKALILIETSEFSFHLIWYDLVKSNNMMGIELDTREED